MEGILPASPMVLTWDSLTGKESVDFKRNQAWGVLKGYHQESGHNKSLWPELSESDTQELSQMDQPSILTTSAGNSVVGELLWCLWKWPRYPRKEKSLSGQRQHQQGYGSNGQVGMPTTYLCFPSRHNDKHRAEQQMRWESGRRPRISPRQNQPWAGSSQTRTWRGSKGFSLDGSLMFYLNCRYFEARKWVLAEISLSFNSDGRFCWWVGRKRDKKGTRKQCWGWNCVHSLESPNILAPATYIWIWFGFEDLSHFKIIK